MSKSGRSAVSELGFTGGNTNEAYNLFFLRREKKKRQQLRIRFRELLGVTKRKTYIEFDIGESYLGKPSMMQGA